MGSDCISSWSLLIFLLWTCSNSSLIRLFTTELFSLESQKLILDTVSLVLIRFYELDLQVTRAGIYIKFRRSSNPVQIRSFTLELTGEDWKKIFPYIHLVFPLFDRAEQPLNLNNGEIMFTIYCCCCCCIVFYGPSTHFRSFRARSVNLSTLFLAKPPRQFTST